MDRFVSSSKRQRHHRLDSAPPALLEILEPRQLFSVASTTTLHDDLQILKDSTSSANIQGYTPAQIKQAYEINQITFDNGTVTGDGAGETIAIVDAYNAPTIENDLSVFDSQFGLAAPPSFKVINGNGGTTLPANNAGWAGEISLDVEWAHAIAPDANIVLVEAESDSLTDLLAAVDTARNEPGVSVVSMSWGGSEFESYYGTEFTGETSDDSTFTTPEGHTNVTFVASAGDSGVFDGVQWPAVSPNVLSVGGTSLYTYNDGTYYTEQGWQGTSGGESQVEATPAYQQNADPYSYRTSPDVAFDADPNTGVAVYDSYADNGYVGWQEVGGTSVGAPCWSAIIAIANQGRAISSVAPLDGASQTLPTLYSLYSEPDTSGYSTYTTYFNDVIDQGSNFFFRGVAATAGYDILTGLGSPIAPKIVDALANISSSGGSTTPTNPTSPTLSASFLDVLVTSTAPTSGTIVGDSTGSVTLTISNTDIDDFSGPLLINLYAISGTTISSTAEAFDTISIPQASIASGQSITEKVKFTFPTNLPNGSYHIAAAVTATGTSTAAADAVTAASVTLDQPTVDLSVSSRRSGVSLTAGHRKSIAVWVTNTGNTTAAGTYTVDLYESADTTLDASDLLLTAVTGKLKLRPGHSRLVDLVFTAPTAIAAGSYNLIAAVSSTTRPVDVDTADKDVVIKTTA